MDMNIPPSVSAYSTGIDVSQRDIDELFPKVDPEFEPFGQRVLVQLRRVVNKSAGGIILSQETKTTEAWNINVARVIKCGPLAFKRRDDSMLDWPEGVWAREGDFVMVPRHGGDRRSIDLNDGLEPVVLVLFDDRHLLGRVTGNPCKIRAYVA